MSFHQPLAVIQKAKSNDYFRRAIDTPAYRDAVALREAALTKRTQLPAIPTPPQRPGDPADLDSWLDAVVKSRMAEEERETRYNALTSAINQCDGEIAAVVDVFPDEVLAVLGEGMSDLMAHVTDAVQRLDGARTPDEVIAAGVGDAWNELRTLRNQYDQLRDAQTFVMADEMSRHTSNYFHNDPHASRLLIRNIDDIFPAWNDGTTQTFTMSGTPSDPRPWPTDPTSQLVWLSSSTAEVWLPTFAQLDQLQQELHRKHNPEPKMKPGRPDKPKQTFGNAVHRRASVV